MIASFRMISILMKLSMQHTSNMEDHTGSLVTMQVYAMRRLICFQTLKATQQSLKMIILVYTPAYHLPWGLPNLSNFKLVTQNVFSAHEADS